MDVSFNFAGSLQELNYVYMSSDALISKKCHLINSNTRQSMGGGGAIKYGKIERDPN